MKIIISPAKKMNVDRETLPWQELPVFLAKTYQLMDFMKRLSFAQSQAIWKCNENLTELNVRRFREMNPQQLTENLTPAILSYEGIQYQYMAPSILDKESLGYLQEHLRILSGFYGVLKPFDGVVPYRLEMQARLGGYLPDSDLDSLYTFWGNDLAEEVWKEEELVLNLASKEYSKCLSKYRTKGRLFITCVFGEFIDGKIKEKGTLAKMARGEMVRYLAENQVESLEGVKGYDRLGYRYVKEYSRDDCLVFLKGQEE